MSLRAVPGPIRLLRVPSALGLCLLGAVILLLLGYRWAAAGVGMGFILYAVNGFFLYETGRSLLTGGSAKTVRWVAAGSSAGRLLLLGMSLGAIGVFLGREAVLGAGGGLLVSQLNLRLPFWTT